MTTTYLQWLSDDLITPRHIGSEYLLNQEVGGRKIEVDRGRSSERAQGVVRGYGDIVSLGHSGNLARFPQSTTVADIRLGDRTCALLEKLSELVPSYEALSGSNRNARRTRHLDHPLHVLRRTWFLDEVRTVWLQCAGVRDGRSRRSTTVKVYHDVHAVAQFIAKHLHHPGGAPDRVHVL